MLHTFIAGANDGAYPYSGLTLIGSTLYGTTNEGGTANQGMVFAINANGTDFQILHSFAGGTTDGAYPYSSLTAIGSTLYGTTNNGGTANDGTIFSISSTGTGFQLLHSFTETTSDGAFPYAGMTAIGTTLYGTTNNGGTADDGTLFSITTTGTNFQVLHSFTGTTTDGAVPDAVLTVVGSTFYGTTDEGGTADKGTVFAIGTNGAGFQVIHSFTETTTDGAFPKVGVIASGSTLYGATVNGGTADDGTVFSLSTNGTGFQLLHSFAGTTDGALPFGGLTLVGSTLFGTTNGGSSGANSGTVFSLGTNGTGFQLLHTFVNGANDGAYPYSALTLVGSSLYGTTNGGGTLNGGTIYDITGALPAGPQVTDVLVDGSSWATSFKNALATAGEGNGTGFAIPVGSAAQLKDLPWSNVNQIQIVFNENVNIQANSLVVISSSLVPYTFANFTYSSATHTAIWTLNQPIGAGKFSLDLQSTGANAVTDTAANPLDGDWTDGVSSYPSGDGAAGGDFDFAFNVLPGDDNQDGIINAQDLAPISSNWSGNNIVADINGDGIVNGQDLAVIAASWLATIPASGAAVAAPAFANATTGQSQVVANASIVGDADPTVVSPAGAVTSIASSVVPTAIGSSTTTVSLAQPAAESLPDSGLPVTVTTHPDPFLSSSGETGKSLSSLGVATANVSTAVAAPAPLDRVAASLGPVSGTLDVHAVDRLMSQASQGGEHGSSLALDALTAATVLQNHAASHAGTLDAAFADDQPWSLISDQGDGRIKTRA